MHLFTQKFRKNSCSTRGTLIFECFLEHHQFGEIKETKLKFTSTKIRQRIEKVLTNVVLNFEYFGNRH